MRISVKGRYALAAAIVIADRQRAGARMTVAGISEELGFSKIYLEQVFAQLKKAGILASTKGPKGGYQFARPPAGVTAWEVLSALETGLAEDAEDTVADADPGIEVALRTGVYAPLDAAVKEALSGISLQSLLDAAIEQREEQSYMVGI